MRESALLQKYQIENREDFTKNFGTSRRLQHLATKVFAELKVSQAGGSRDESSGEATKAEGFVTLEIPVDGV